MSCDAFNDSLGGVDLGPRYPTALLPVRDDLWITSNGGTISVGEP